MPLVRDDLPYSKKRLEDFAVAFGVNSGYLWVTPRSAVHSFRENTLRAPVMSPNPAVELQDNKEKV